MYNISWYVYFPIRWKGGLFLTFSVDTILKFGARIMIVFMVIPVHEFAHAWSADKMGDPTPRAQNRLNLNPFNHIDPIGGLFIILGGFGWGRPVQVNPNNFKKPRKGMAISAAAGPIANVVAATVGVVFYKVTLYNCMVNYSEALYWTTVLFYYFTVINLGLAIFNLIPIAPLDGSKILSYFIGRKVEIKLEQYSFIIFTAFVLLIFSGLLDGPLDSLNEALFWVIDKLTFWVDLIIKGILHIN